MTGIHAQAQSFTFTKVVRPLCSIEIYGFGSTAAEALNNALAEAKSKYLIFRDQDLRSAEVRLGQP